MGHWYVVQTNPQNERKATGELRRAGLRVYLPQSASEVVHKRTKQRTVKRRVLMAGYLFVRFPDQMLDPWGTPPFIVARSCQGVKGLLTAANEAGEWAPLGIPDSIVAAFMRRQRRREWGKPAVESSRAHMARLKAKYAPGVSVHVVEGPFAGFNVEIQRLLESGAVEAEFTVFGRPTKVRFEKPETELRIAA